MSGGHHLQILPDGTVHGQRDTEVYSRLTAVAPGVVVIKGQKSERYLAINKEGRLYASPVVNDECHFLERLEENNYNTYKSQKYQEKR